MGNTNGHTRLRDRDLSRRTMLRGVGVGMALPLLHAMSPATARAQAASAPRRMFAVCNNLGLLPGEFFPAHRLLRRVAPQRGWRTPGRHQFPDGSPAPGEQFVPQHHLARPTRGARSLSWTGNGVGIPPEQNAAGVFRQMFIQGSPKEVEAKIAELDTGRSILDAVAGQVRDLERSVGAADRARLPLPASETWKTACRNPKGGNGNPSRW